MPRRRLTIAALTVTALAASGASAVAATHPIITDPAGDARSFLGGNQRLADLLSADISHAEGDLLVTQRLAALPASNATASSTYTVQSQLSTTNEMVISRITAANVNVPANAVLEIGSSGGGGGSTGPRQVNGTPTFDRAAGTVTVRYPVAGLLSANGVPLFVSGSTVLRRPTANVALTNTPLGLSNARDSAAASADYVFGT